MFNGVIFLTRRGNVGTNDFALRFLPSAADQRAVRAVNELTHPAVVLESAQAEFLYLALGASIQPGFSIRFEKDLDRGDPHENQGSDDP